MCRFINRTRFMMTVRMARPLSPSMPVIRLVTGWITILIGMTVTSLSGARAIHVPTTGGMNLAANAIEGMRVFGARVIIQAQGRQIVETEAMRPLRLGTGPRELLRGENRRQRRDPLLLLAGRLLQSGDPNRLSPGDNQHAKFRSRMNGSTVFPEQRHPPLNVLLPSAGRKPTARSSASKVRMKQEPIATVANRACALLPLHRQLRAQRLPAVAVATPAAVVVAVVEAVVVAEEGAVAINNFQKKH